MQNVELSTLGDLLSVTKELQKLLEETPQIVSFLKAVEDLEDKNKIVGLARSDSLVTTGEAAKILKVSKGTMYAYVKEGLLEPVYTPRSSQMKFWVSEVRSIPQRGGTHV